MQKVELLSPAGNMKSLKMAIKCGCDAVYISGKDYGARKFADNFTMEEIEEATRYSHLYGVKLYVTINTLIEEDDIDLVLTYISNLYEFGVDALIVQDLGLISIIRHRFPNIQIHVSTGAHNCSNECLEFLDGLGVKRVVLARELSISEISKLDTTLELEVFIHGALCVSYSGQCLMSSYLFGRSGNKGECSQPCRFCYDIYEDDKIAVSNKYVLSMKDLCIGDNIKSLLDMGISSLKIEGRMKSCYYVGYVTKFYRMLIDKYYNNEELSFTEEEYNNLLVLYNRCFTKGFLNDNYDVVNPDTCNHRGILVGKVISCSNKIKILLDKDLSQGDGIRFSNGKGMICNYIYNENGLLINKGFSSDIIYLDNKINLNSKGFVYKTLDSNLHKEIENSEDRTILIDFEVVAKIGKELVISVYCSSDKITKSLGMVFRANKSSVSKKDIYDKLSKLGNTPFKINNIYFDVDDDIFIPIKNINNLRRELINDLICLRENRRPDVITTNEKIVSRENSITNEISFLVRNELQLKFLIDKNVNIYVEDYFLYQKYKDNNIFYRNPRASFDYKNSSNTLITNNGGFKYYCDKSVSDIYMNVKNSLTLGLFSNYVYKVGLSPELNNEDIYKIICSYKKRFGFNPNVEVLIYGNLELMLMKYCPLNYFINNSNRCSMCFSKNFYLDDKHGHKFNFLRDEIHNMRIMSDKKIDKILDINYLKSIGVTNFRIDLLDEDDLSIQKILDRVNCSLQKIK